MEERMKRDITTIIIGILFLITGIAVGGSMLGFFDFSISFAGWWTVFIIAPALLSIIQGGFNVGNIILLFVGGTLLLNAQGILPNNFSWRLIFPLVLFIVGFQLLFGNRNGASGARFGGWSRRAAGCCGTGSSGDAGTTAGTGHKTASVAFSGQDIRYGNEEFTGGTYTAVFGGLTINLRSVTIVGDVVIYVTALCGGIDLILPDNVRVVSNVIPILGGADCTYTSSADPLAPKVIINGNVTFGGVNIK
jgi:hypothetical protein